MTFLAVLCEGYTEMDFVAGVLREHLMSHGIIVQPFLLGNQIKHDVASALGGVSHYAPVYRQIQATLRSHASPTSRVTTLLDLYAFPRDFPDYDQYASILDPYERVARLEAALKQRVNNSRFIPNIQLHEFEALVLSKPDEILGEFLDHPPHEGLMALLADLGDLPAEMINQTKEGAPSKRLQRFLPGYNKRTMGPNIVRRIGLQQLKTSCPHFGAWVSLLEGLGA